MQATFDKAALVQRCQLYKLRVMDHLPERQRPRVQAIMRQAYRSDGPDGTATAARSRAPSRRRALSSV